MASFHPHLSTLPPTLDLLDCPYMEPHCDAPLYAGARPLLFNLTLLESGAQHGARHVRRPTWRPLRAVLGARPSAAASAAAAATAAGAEATATTTAAELTDDEISDDEIADDEISDDEIADVLDVSFAWSPSLDAGVGFVGVALAVRLTRREWEGVVTGEILIEVSSEAEFYGAAPTTAPTTAPTAAPTTRSVRVPLRVRIRRTPPRHRRLLLDLFHSTSYPNGFFPTDELEAHAIDLMDVRGDHPHTNLRALTTALRAAGFYVETLSGDVSSDDL